jgi:hypothetical protein
MAIAAITMRIAPARLGMACFLIMAIGYYAYGLATSFESILPGIVFASVGFHLWITLSGSFSLAVAKEGNAGRTLGDLQAIGFTAGLVGIVCVYAGIDAIGFPTAFALAGILMLAGGLAIGRFPSVIVERSPQRAVVRHRYLLYYVLNFLEGCRFELFQAFGIFLLVQHYRLPVQAIAILFVLTAVSSGLLSPVVGRLIDHSGERPIMTAGYLGMLGCFLGFALWHDTNAVVVLYVVYNILLLVEIGVNTYLKRVADPGDVRPSLATGVTIMHIPALVVPILGGALWNAFGFEVPFLLGAGFIVGSLAATQYLPRLTALSALETVQAH